MSAELAQQVANGLIVGGAYALMAVGLTMIFGMMEVVNFAHGELYMLGALFAYSFVTDFGLNYFVAIALAVPAVMALGWAIERLTLRPLRGETEPILLTVLVTIGISIFLKNTALVIWGPRPKLLASPFPLEPFELGPVSVTPARLFAFLVTVAAIAGFHLLVQRTRLGRAMRATFQDAQAAALAGVEIDQVHALTFVLGSGLAATAGVLLGSIFLVDPQMGELAVLKAFVVVILGGMGSFPGAIVGGLILGVAESAGAGFISTGYKDAIGFVIVILLLLFKPSGLFGMSEARE